MRNWKQVRAEALGDLLRGRFVPLEDQAIAALVVMPFTATLMVFLSQASPRLPSLWLIVLFVIVQIAATLWNAGWRARTSEPNEG